MSLRNLTVATTLVALTAVGGFWFSPAAHAAPNVKDCGSTTTTTAHRVALGDFSERRISSVRDIGKKIQNKRPFRTRRRVRDTGNDFGRLRGAASIMQTVLGESRPAHNAGRKGGLSKRF